MKIFKFTWSTLARYLNDKYPANSHKLKSERLRSLVFKRVIFWLGIIVHVSCIFWKYTSDSTGLGSELNRSAQISSCMTGMRQNRSKQELFRDEPFARGNVHSASHFHHHPHHGKKFALYAVCLDLLFTDKLKNLVLDDAFTLERGSSGSTKIHLCF